MPQFFLGNGFQVNDVGTVSDTKTANSGEPGCQWSVAAHPSPSEDLDSSVYHAATHVGSHHFYTCNLGEREEEEEEKVTV